MAAVERAFRAICGALHPAKNADANDIAQASGSAVTLVEHFTPIMDRVLNEHMPNMEKSTLRSILKRGPQAGNQMLPDGCDE